MGRLLGRFGPTIIASSVLWATACGTHGLYPEYVPDAGVEDRRACAPECDPGRRGNRAPRDAAVRPDSPPRDAGPSTGDPREIDLPFEPLKPNVMLLVDRSSAMNAVAPCAAPPCQTWWSGLLALTDTLEEVAEWAHVGLALFPSTDAACDADGSVVVPLYDAPGVADEVGFILETTAPLGSAPMAAAVDEIIAHGQLDDPTRPNLLVILTRGAPDCACADPLDVRCERDAAVAAMAKLAQRTPPIHTQIVGMGSDAAESPGLLRALARAAGSETYAEVETVAALGRALSRAASSVRPCTFVIEAPVAGEALVVRVDGSEVRRCVDSPCEFGYTYDAQALAVALSGRACDRVRDGEPHSVRLARRR